MNEETIRRLPDSYTACANVAAFTHGATIETYRASLLLRSAVERQFEIVGEALNRAAMLHQDLESLIPELRDVVGLRNRLVHGYDVVDDQIIWDLVQDELPMLKARLSIVLGDLGVDLPWSLREPDR